MKGITHRIVTVNSCGYRCWRCCCLVAKLCLTFVPPHGLIACQARLTMRIFQARILEWVTISCNKYILLHWWIYMHKDRWVCFLLLLSCSVMSNSWRPHVLQHARLPCPLPSPRVCSNSCPLSQWCHPTISPSVIPYTSCLQSFRASESFLMTQLFTSGGQSIGASATASVLPMNIQGWFPLGLTVLISLQPKGLSRIFSNTTVWKNQFFSTQPSLWSNSHIHSWLLENKSFD